MKSVGQILKDARLSLKLEVEDVSRITKIRPSFINSIEADNYSRLPNGATARGFIRNYSVYLSLNPEHVLAAFRRDFVENQQGQIVPRGISESVHSLSLWTPKTTITALVALVFVFFGFYLIYQYRLLIGPPLLKITSPPDNQIVAETSLEITGQTDPEATISVNGQLVALDKGGLFSVRFPLHNGSNKFTVIATGKSGRTNSQTKVVNLTTP